MKLNAVAVTTSNFEQSIKFYELLGFVFEKPETLENIQHIEGKLAGDSIKLMIDSSSLMKQILGSKPKSSNHSNFAIECENADKVNLVVKEIKEAGFDIEKEPWDADWGQRYCILKDPEGYLVDLYAAL